MERYDTPTLLEQSVSGRRAASLPECDVPAPEVEEILPTDLLREDAPKLPEVSEPQLVRHFTRLSQKNFSIDTHFYPLGSCTMKYNPRLNETVAAIPGFAQAHPYQPDESVQGLLNVFYDLRQMLERISGLSEVSLQPAAGAHGELTSLMIIRAYFEDRGETDRDQILIPDSAHGTNPASVSFAGMKSVELKSDEAGIVDLEDLKAKLSDRVAGLMITNPNTLGLFDRNIREIADCLHDAGALLYLDGANMNALVGRVRPGDFGVDVMHYNLHKTFSTPHGGGGPGSGPIAVCDKLRPYLPLPRLTKDEDGTCFWDYEGFEKSIGRVKGFYGQTGMVVRAYSYLRSYSAEQLRAMSGHAVLNANYLRIRLRDTIPVPYPGVCMHEFVSSAKKLKKETDVIALDVAKRLADYGFHAPTIYFPLIVSEALMIEPTESESKETLDRFIEALERIVEEARTEPETVQNAPHHLPVTRLDEAQAARCPCLTLQPDIPGKTETLPR